MKATLQGLDAVAWSTLHPNNTSGSELRLYIEQIGKGEADALPQLADAVLHQGTVFGGAAEVLPFLVELAIADETPERANLIYLASGIGAPVEVDTSAWLDSTVDRQLIASMSDEELWETADFELLDGFSAMCAIDSRAVWLAALPDISRLVEDPEPEVRTAAIVSLASEREVPAEHEGRLRHALQEDGGDVSWHAALALGHLAQHRSLADETLGVLRAQLGHRALAHRSSAAFALVFAQPLEDSVFEALAEAEAGYSELSKLNCRFGQAITGMIAIAIHRV